MKNKGYVYAVLFLMILFLAGGTSYAGQFKTKYEVTITNLTRGQIFSPPIVISHNWNFQLFALGDEASPQLMALAEEGDTSQLIDQINMNADYNYAVSEGPVLPGESGWLSICRCNVANSSSTRRRLASATSRLCVASR